MSTPEGHKDLWKNINWKTKREKLAFFNHYFKKGHIAADYCKEQIQAFKSGLIEFIKEGRIKDKDGKERPITMADVIAELNKSEG